MVCDDCDLIVPYPVASSTNGWSHEIDTQSRHMDRCPQCSENYFKIIGVEQLSIAQAKAEKAYLRGMMWVLRHGASMEYIDIAGHFETATSIVRKKISCAEAAIIRASNMEAAKPSCPATARLVAAGALVHQNSDEMTSWVDSEMESRSRSSDSHKRERRKYKGMPDNWLAELFGEKRE
jgi:hypothetical protein